MLVIIGVVTIGFVASILALGRLHWLNLTNHASVSVDVEVTVSADSTFSPRSFRLEPSETKEVTYFRWNVPRRERVFSVAIRNSEGETTQRKGCGYIDDVGPIGFEASIATIDGILTIKCP